MGVASYLEDNIEACVDGLAMNLNKANQGARISPVSVAQHRQLTEANAELCRKSARDFCAIQELNKLLTEEREGKKRLDRLYERLYQRLIQLQGDIMEERQSRLAAEAKLRALDDIETPTVAEADIDAHSRPEQIDALKPGERHR